MSAAMRKGNFWEKMEGQKIYLLFILIYIYKRIIAQFFLNVTPTSYIKKKKLILANVPVTGLSS